MDSLPSQPSPTAPPIPSAPPLTGGRLEDSTSVSAPSRYVPALGLAFFGLYLALITPAVVSMSFKLQHITDDATAATGALGMILGIGGLVSLVASPLAGRLSDRTTSRFGRRRPWIVGGAVVAFLSLLANGFATSVFVLGAAWAVAQVGLSCALSALTATLPDQVPAGARGKVAGVVGIATPVATLGGTGLVSLLSSDVLRFAVPALIALVLCVGFALTLKDVVLLDAPTERFGAKQFFGSFAFNVRRHPDFGWAWLARFAVNFAYIGVSTFLPMFIVERFALSEQDTIQVVFASHAVIAVSIAISSPIGGWLSDRFQNRRFFVALGGGLLVLGLLLIAFASSVEVLLAAQLLTGLGAGAFYSVDLALATEVLPTSSDTAKDLGVLNISSALPQSLAPALGPVVIALGAMTPLGGYTVWYIFGAAVALAGSVLVFRIRGVR